MRVFAAALALATSTSAYELSSGARCGTEDIPEMIQNRVEEITLNFAKNVCSKTLTPEKIPMCGVKDVDPIISEIPVAFHILHYEDGRNNITQARIDETMEIINNDFAGRPGNGNYANTNFRFALHSVDRWANNIWASSALIAGGGLSGYPDFPENWGYKPEIGIDQANILNLYIGEMRGGVLGMCPFPFFGPPDSNIHGCVIHPGALVGGDIAPYNEGGTATHEIGHGLGLWHVWQGGCNRNTDMVEDTNPQETNSRGCPEPVTDSCGDGLPDNIHNHMDYSEDSCRYEFTIGQSERADMVVAAWHPGYLNPEIQEAIRKADPNAWSETMAFQTAFQAEHEHNWFADLN